MGVVVTDSFSFSKTYFLTTKVKLEVNSTLFTSEGKIQKEAPVITRRLELKAVIQKFRTSLEGQRRYSFYSH